jgi:SAM-dependent methyltransferase
MPALPTVPPYFDGLLEGFRRGAVGRHVHLGLWEGDGGDRADFEAAQARLVDRLLDMAELADGQWVADVGCGLGGTLQAADRRHGRLRHTGINIDPRQHAACAQLAPRPGNRFDWLLADALALPLPQAAVDRLLCVEAMFHFASRQQFFHEAARVLKPGGIMVASDLLPCPCDDPVADARIERQVVNSFGPWPDFWSRDADHAALAATTGLRLEACIDASASTRPSHRHTAPLGPAAVDPLGRAAAALAALHEAGRLKVLLLRLRRV